MFDFVRNHTRLALGFMLLLIIPSFIFFGVQGYTRFADASNDTVAHVDGLAIKRSEWEDQQKRYVDNLRRQAPNIDPATLDTPQLRHETLEGMVRERLMLAAANQLHLFPSDARLKRLFVDDPQYAPIRRPDGTVMPEALVGMGLSVGQFEQRLRQDFGVRQVLGGITQTVPPAALPASAALDAFMERRAVQLQRFDPIAYREKATPTDAELEAYYKAHQADFAAPEQATIEYVVLDLQSLGKGLVPTDEEMKAAYEAFAKTSRTPDERRASHILIAADKDKPAAERAKAKARAEALLAEVRKNPSSFAELAKKNSNDPGSAAQGGDLDWHPRGDMVPAFDAMMFKLKQGEISDVVETDFGYHIITVTGIRGGSAKSFEQARPELEAEWRKTAALKLWTKSADAFTDTVYQKSDSLKPAVDKLQAEQKVALEIKTATVQRSAPADAAGPLASKKLLDAVFSNEVVRDKRNTDAIETAPNQLVAARIVKHEPARSLTLDEVKPRVRDTLVVQQAAVLARKEGEARLAALKAGTGGDVPLPVQATVSRMQAQGMPRPLLDAVLRADPAKLPVVSGVDLGPQGYVVLRVTQVLPREAPPGGEEAARNQYAQAWASAETDAYVNALKKRFKAKIEPAADLVVEAASAPARR